MKRTKSHKINEKGMRQFEGSLPSGWVANSQNKDYGKDYLVEIGENNEQLSGDSFYVQLKSQEIGKRNRTNEYVSVKLQSKHAKYYSKLKDLPLFFVVADIVKEKCYYIFLQPVLAKDISWKHSREITIRVPVQNDLSNHNALKQAVNDAKLWLRRRHPSSICDAAKAKETAIREIDPRFDAQVSFANDQLSVALIPKEKVRFQIHLASDVSKQKFANVIESGTISVFEANEIAFSGSDLFSAFPPTKVEIHPKTSVGTIIISDKESLDESSFRSIEFHAIVQGGTKSLTFLCKLKASPLAIEIRFEEDQMLFSFNFNASVWEGMGIRNLPYFDAVKEFFGYLSRNPGLFVHFYKEGNKLATQYVDGTFEPTTDHINALLEDMYKARQIFGRFNRNPEWTFDAFCDAGIYLDQCFALITSGYWEGECSFVELTVTLRKRNELEKLSKEKTQNQHLKLVSEMWYELLGEKIPVGRIAQEFSEMSIVNCKSTERKKTTKKKETQKRKKNSQSNAAVSVRFRGSSKCIRVLRIENADE